MTNADKIRQMTDEELALIISENIDCGCCEAMHGNKPCENGVCCPVFWLGWLKQEVKDGCPKD